MIWLSIYCLNPLNLDKKISRPPFFRITGKGLGFLPDLLVQLWTYTVMRIL